MYAVIVSSKKVLTIDNSVITKEGEKFWVIREPEGWVPATSTKYHNDDQVPGIVKQFKTVPEAEAFIKDWGGHPWYCKPNGTYRIVKLEPMYRMVHSGYKVV